MKLDKVLCCVILLWFLALTVLKTQQLFTTDQATNQQRRLGYVTHAKCMSAKQKIVPGR